MPRDIRKITTDDEWQQRCFIGAYAFAGDRRQQYLDHRLKQDDRDECHGAFENGELVAALNIMPFEQHINGARIRTGGIAGVASLPERRREGHVAALLKHALTVMHDAGEPLSMLYTPHHALYNRYGWSVAARAISYWFAPKAPRVRLTAGGGRIRRVTPGDWRTLDQVYAQSVAARNGAITRDEPWWRFLFDPVNPADAAVYYNDDGEPRGYLLYRFSRHDRPGAFWREVTMRIFDWAALDASAYAAIVRYIVGHDHDDRIVIQMSEDEPFVFAFEEPNDMQPRASHNFLLRIVDVQRAVEARPALAQASGKCVTISLTDTHAPWNAGAWHIACSEGRVSAERTGARPDLEMDARAFAPIFNGFVRPADAVRIGEVRAHNPDAIAAATDIFAASCRPYCADDF